MNSKITLFTIFLVALLVLLAPTTEARRSAPTVTPAKNYEQDVAGLGLYGRGFPHAWGVDKTKNHNDVRNVVKKKKVRRGKEEEM
mmetsp:Transcript_1331/g.2641  ORF Transcript_1331/g.2641 Transcript_1331/m.2641 type:complete len:85 (+) Transcript_1331:245-499(+)